MTKSDDNYRFFIKTDTSAYKGEWVAIAKEKVVAHGHDAQEVYAEAVKKSGGAHVSLAKTPNEQMLVHGAYCESGLGVNRRSSPSARPSRCL